MGDGPLAADADARAARRSRARTAASPSFSVVIPTYQRREVVREAVNALAQVEYDGDVEVIVVVDGSTDGTAEALSRMDCPFRLTVIEQPNAGPSAARNRGAALARNEVILFLDDDMICEPDLLEQHGALYRAGADAIIGDTPIHPASPGGFLPESVSRWIASTSVKSPLSPFDIFSGQLSVRRAVFEELGGFDNAFTSAAAFGNEDADFGVRLLAGYDVRHNPASISRQIYVVSPREYMERAQSAVAADIRFMQKHPELARQLLDAKGMNRPLARWIYLPLSRIPFVPELIARLAVRIADAAIATPFRSNRMIARFFSGARSLAYWSALRRSGWIPFSDRALILCYHAIEDQSDDPVLAPYGVPPGLFADHLDSLSRRGFSFVSPGQLAAFLEVGAPLPRRPVLLSFDDGYADLLDLAREVLRPRGIEALAFVVTGLESRTNEWDQPHGAKTIELLSTEDLRTVTSLGVEIGSHSRTHREMPTLTVGEQELEARGSSDDLVHRGFPRPRFFAYPYGALDERSKRAAAKAGYLAAFGITGRRLSRRSDRFDLPRVMVLSTDRGWRFRMRTAAPAMFSWFVRGRHALDRAFGQARA